jgi:hypothetical protein
MMQTGERHNLRYEVSAGDCGRFDYCLRLRGAPRGAKA